MEASREDARKYSTKIENLPECILIHILSFLTTLDAIRTTLVCHTLRNLWYQVLSLSFSIIPLLSLSNPYMTTRNKFIKCVNQDISIHPFTHLNKFHIDVDCCAVDSHINNVHNWLDNDFDIYDLYWIMTETNYREVDKFEEFLFDFSHLKDSSVKILKLRRSSINCPSYVLGSSGFQSVQSLFFDDFNLFNREVNEVIKFCIYSSKLKKCALEPLFTSEVVISAPRLHSISTRKVCAVMCFFNPRLVVAMKCALEPLFTSEVVISAPRLHSISTRKVCAVM
ncbi:hypothetical protein ACJIZ3_006109 [Penstemon smallii]|uniref:F-box domain-containing protein n=1 Tax=Penstemon smallii TaxID=265156 RepID=A0ABD3S6Q6_9LAMI